MDKQQIQQVLIEVLTEIQTNSGQPAIEIDEDTSPIGDLPGFDSLTGIEATVELTHRLGHQIGQENIFVSAQGTRALPIREIAERLYRITNPEVASNDRTDS
jgi:acyl carrier protein